MTEQILRCRRPIRILAAALALAMTLAMTLVCVPRAQAYMWPAGDQNLNIKCYTLSTGNTAVYSTKDCAVKCGTVFGSDLITLLNACGDAIQISYPISGGADGLRMDQGLRPLSRRSEQFLLSAHEGLW